MWKLKAENEMSKKISKRYKELLQKTEQEKVYSADEAVTSIKDLASAKFDETVEISMKLNVDPKHADQMVRGSVVLPSGTGKVVRVAVIAKEAKVDEAKAAGADIAGGSEIIDDIAAGKMDFDVLIATPDMMGMVGKVGRTLGPKGLMPNPKTGTVTMDVAKAVTESKGGKVNFRVDKHGNLQAGIGKASFSQEHLKENFDTFIIAVNKQKPAVSKGRYIKSAALSLTMSPSLNMDALELSDMK